MQTTFLIALAFLLLIQAGCNEHQAKEKQSQAVIRAKEAEERDRTIEEFRQKYGADSNAVKELDGIRLSTIALQNLLIRPNGQPVVAAVSVFDVEKIGNEYLLQLYLPNGARSIFFRQQLMFQLKCKLPTIEINFVEHSYPMTWAANYLVAARIQDIKQSHHFSHSDDRLDGVDTEFIGLGECLGLEPIRTSANNNQSVNQGKVKSH